MKQFRGELRDWTPQYAAIGQFVVEFEWICWSLRFHSGALLQLHGLRNWQLAEIIFNQRSFTAEPLFSCYASMVAECFGTDHELTKELDTLRKEFQALCKLRNDLLHATYLIGPGVIEVTDKDQPFETHVEKRTPDKNGARVQMIASTIEEQRQYVTQAISTKEKMAEFYPKIVLELHRRGTGGQPGVIA